MTQLLTRLLLSASVAFLAAGASPSAATGFECAAPKEATRLKVKLPNTARAIRRGKELVIVAVGSSSTEGVGASSPGNTYPARLAHELAAYWPSYKIRVVNSGIRGETAGEMLARFEKDVMPHKPHLVIWQTGSNTVLKGGSFNDYAETLRKGVARLKAANTDIILMDPQYAPRVIRQPALRRMVDFMRQTADDLGIGLFQRFAIMRHWIDSGEAKVEDVIARDQLHMNDAGYGCIAHLLADIVTEVARGSPAGESQSASQSKP
ncbi:MAG: SGNH/GDSL hydrolase family protein [Rhodospirillales bacterium]|nr:SGNH/GDSL hydrolase family protein [Rhodospirillales bacterium]